MTTHATVTGWCTCKVEGMATAGLEVDSGTGWWGGSVRRLLGAQYDDMPNIRPATAAITPVSLVTDENWEDCTK